MAAHEPIKVPLELDDRVNAIVAQHLDLYDWGTSNPIYDRLASRFVQTLSTQGGPRITGVDANTRDTDTTVAGIFDPRATDMEVNTQFFCGPGSYLEGVSDRTTNCADNSGFPPFSQVQKVQLAEIELKKVAVAKIQLRNAAQPDARWSVGKSQRFSVFGIFESDSFQPTTERTTPLSTHGDIAALYPLPVASSP